jgi:hypothetical protein
MICCCLKMFRTAPFCAICTFWWRSIGWQKLTKKPGARGAATLKVLNWNEPGNSLLAFYKLLDNWKKSRRPLEQRIGVCCAAYLRCQMCRMACIILRGPCWAGCLYECIFPINGDTWTCFQHSEKRSWICVYLRSSVAIIFCAYFFYQLPLSSLQDTQSLLLTEGLHYNMASLKGDSSRQVMKDQTINGYSEL